MVRSYKKIWNEFKGRLINYKKDLEKASKVDFIQKIELIDVLLAVINDLEGGRKKDRSKLNRWIRVFEKLKSVLSNNKPKCPVCDACPLIVYERPDEPYTYVICEKCGSLLNYTPFGMEVREKYKYKYEILEETDSGGFGRER